MTTDTDVDRTRFALVGIACSFIYGKVTLADLQDAVNAYRDAVATQDKRRGGNVQ